MTSEMIQPVLAAPSCAQTILTERLKRTTPPQASSASEEKKKSRRRFRDTALTYLHVQVNPPGNVSWLIFDLDDVHPLEWQEKLLPPPNIIVSKPVPKILKKDEKEYSAHLFYAIQNVPTTRAANRAPIGFVNDVRRKMRITLGADRDYTGPLCKNPLHSYWKTSYWHAHEYSLNELNDAFDRPEECVRADFNWDEVPDSRNCTLFHESRFEAYGRVAYAKRHLSYEQWHEHVYGLATDLNNYSNKNLSKTRPLKPNEVLSVAKSVSSWTWDKYNPKHNRGVAGLRFLPFTLSKKLAQQEGARYTHRTRNEETRQKIKKAVKQLKLTGERLTQVEVAEKSGLARQTVAKHKDLLKC